MKDEFSILSIIVYLAMAIVCRAKLDNMGPCRSSVVTDSTMNFNEYISENNGLWYFQMVPKTDFTEDLEKMYIVNKPSDTPGTFHVTIYHQKKGKSPDVFAKETVKDFLKGQLTAISTDEKGTEITFMTYFIKYVPGRYAYYSICSELGGDENTDYRYVLAIKNLTDQEIATINNIDKTLKFRNSLKKIKI